MRKQLTGEPVAGELHTGFGGRGRRQPFPTPIRRPGAALGERLLFGTWKVKISPETSGSYRLPFTY